jgi:hypothetical protein
MRKPRTLLSLSLFVCGCLSWASSARADAVVDWNAIAVQSILTPVANGHTTQLSQIDLAIVLASLF